jgi:hypothetical protein
MIRANILNGKDRETGKLFDPSWDNQESQDVRYMNELETQLRAKNPNARKPVQKRALANRAYREGANYDQPLAGNKMRADVAGVSTTYIGGGGMGDGEVGDRQARMEGGGRVAGGVAVTGAIAAAAPIIWPLVSHMVRAVMKRNKNGRGLRPDMSALHNAAGLAEDELKRELGAGAHTNGQEFFGSVIRKAKGALKAAFNRLGPLVTDAALDHLQQRFSGAGVMSARHFKRLASKPKKPAKSARARARKGVATKIKIVEETEPASCDPDVKVKGAALGVPSGRLMWGHLVHPIAHRNSNIMLRRSGLSAPEVDAMLADTLDGEEEFNAPVEHGGAFWSTLGNKVKHFYKKMARNETVRGIASKLADVGKRGLDKAIENLGDSAAAKIGDLGAAKSLEKYTGVNLGDVVRDVAHDTRRGISGSGRRGCEGGYTMRSGGDVMSADMARWIPGDKVQTATGGGFVEEEDPLGRLVSHMRKNAY